MSLATYSQTLALNSSGDTVICYSIDQARYLLKQVYKVQELSELSKIDSLQLKLYESLVATQKSTIVSLEKISKNDKVIILNNESTIADLINKIDKADRKIKRQAIAIKILTVINLTTITLLIIL